MSETKIAILGSGLMGRLIAMRLHQEGFTDLSLIEKDGAQISSSPAMIAAGMLAKFSESVMGGELIYQLGKASISLWRNYLLKLKAQHLLNDSGTLLVAQAKFFSETAHYISKISFNTALDNYYQLLAKPQLSQLEPDLNFNQAYFLPSEGALDAPKVMDSLHDYLVDKVNWRTNSAVSSVDSAGVVIINGNTENFAMILDCRGLGAKSIYPQLRGVRGEIIRVCAPDVRLSRPVRLFHPRHNIYIVPCSDNHYVIGATELETLDYSPVTVRSTMDLLNCAYHIHPGFAEARITSLASSCRPALDNNLPQIKKQNHLIAINGLYRHGFLVAPTLTEEIINYLKNGTQQFIQVWS